ncbi:MAG: hypothetical protein AB7Q17_06260 [Phycisphaerae bacterium]
MPFAILGPGRAPSPRRTLVGTLCGLVVALAFGVAAPRAAAQSERVLWVGGGHSRDIRCVAISPNGEWIATGGGYVDRTVKLWRRSDGRLVRSLSGHSADVSALAFSPNGEWLASGSDDTTVRLWRVADGALLHELPGQLARVTGVTFSPDNRFVLSVGGSGPNARINGYDVGSGAHAFGLPASDGLRDIIFAGNCVYLVAGGENIVITLIDPTTGDVLRELAGHEAPVATLALSADYQIIASGSVDGEVILWHVDSGAIRHRFAAHGGGVRRVAFTPDGRTLVTVGGDGRLRTWNVADAAPRHSSVAHAGAATGVAVAPDGGEFVTVGADAALRRWRSADAAPLGELQQHTAAIRHVALSPRGERVASLGEDGRLWLWDAETGVALSLLSEDLANYACVNFSPDGALLAAAPGYEQTAPLLLFDVEKASLRASIRADQRIEQCAFAPDGTLVTSGGLGFARWRLNEAGGVEQAQPPLAPRRIRAVSFSPDATLALGYDDMNVVMVNTLTGEDAWSLPYSQVDATAGAFAPDGGLFAAAGRNHEVNAFGVLDAASLGTFAGAAEHVRALAFSGDGEWLLGGGGSLAAIGELAVWNARDLRRVAWLDHEAGVGVGTVAASHDGRRYVCGRDDGAIVMAYTFGPPGDLNCDGRTNAFDIQPLVLALSSEAAYRAAYPDCDPRNADVNADGVVNNFDIDAFVERVTQR